MAKQTFTTGQVLTAAQMTSLQQTAMGGGSATPKTASYTLVAADAGTVVQMNSASATTITVNTALFAAGDTVQIQNIGAGVCTVTAGTATVTTAGSLALSQWEGGNLYFTSTSASIFFDIVQAAAASSGPAFRAYASTTQSVTINTFTKIVFGAESFDTDTCFASNDFTPNKAGYYQLNTTINTTGAGGNDYFYIYKNGSAYQIFRTPYAGSGAYNLSDLMYFNGTTDYANVYWYSSAITVQSGADNSSFSGVWIRS